jgi:hypothetical protein
VQVLVFTPPQNGLIAFNQGGLLSYGVFLGTTSDGKIKVYTPDRAVSSVLIDIENTDDYSCKLCSYDFVQLRKRRDPWWKGLIIEVNRKRHTVTRARLSYPTYQWFNVHYEDGSGREREIQLEDPQLKFVGHIEA